MNKPLCVVSCPCDTMSGYGKRSVDFLKSLIKIKGNEWDIKILSQRWGNTPWGNLELHNEIDLISRIIPTLNKQPEYWFQVTIPNEMQRVGKLFSCLVTAGIETDICSAPWIEGCNRADLVLVSSEHAKKAFEASTFEKRNSQTGQPEGIIKLATKVEVLFEGVDLNVYNNNTMGINVSNVHEQLKDIPETFCFLFVGHWLQGSFGEDRKDVGGLIKTFLETFRNKKNKPALILKTQNATPSCIDRDDILGKINTIQKTVTGDLPNIYLLHGELTDNEINLLYNHPKVKAHVSFTKGEGFGRPLLEASLSLKPVITTAWSGHMDFLKPEFNRLIGGMLTPVHPSAIVPDMIIEGSKWFTVNHRQASDIMEDVFNNYPKYLENAKRQAYRSKTEFSLEKMQEKLAKIMDENVPEYKPLILPKLSAITLPKLNKATS
jgi:glycosyltransferase involved in cell wall biosynthesis